MSQGTESLSLHDDVNGRQMTAMQMLDFMTIDAIAATWRVGNDCCVSDEYLRMAVVRETGRSIVTIRHFILDVANT